MRERDDRIVVEVFNSGAQLPKGAEARVFDRFFRAAPQEIEGSGLGLAIARRVAERHAFALTVENRVGGAIGRSGPSFDARMQRRQLILS